MITPHEDAPVISAQVGSMGLRRILVDNEISANILCGHAYNRLDFGGRKLKLCDEHSFYSFGNGPVPIACTIKLLVILGVAPKQASIMVRFYL